MPKLPDLNDLGSRPVPVSRAAIVSEPNAGMVGDAIANLGREISGIARQQFEKQDRLSYASAKAAIANEDIVARRELLNDPDFGTAEQRYTERMKAKQAEALKFIASSGDRALFEVDSSDDINRGLSQISAMVNEKRIDRGRADLDLLLDGLSKSAIDAPDDETRQNVFETVNDMLSGARDSGFITAQEMGVKARSFAATDAGNRIERLLADEEIDKAAGVLESAKGAMPAGIYSDYYGQIQGKLKVRQAADDFAAVTILPPVETKPEGASGKPVANGKSVITAIYPGAVVTSNYRGPDHPLTKKNPQSWHGKSHAAIDVEPIKGMPFDKFLKGIEDAGYRVIEAKDEVANPSAHSTGPHWHVVIGEGGPQQGPRRWDKNEVYASIDAKADKEGWTFERRERAKDYANSQIGRDENLLARQEDEADRAAQEFILGKREAFTDPASIPRRVWSNMSTSARAEAINAAEANRKALIKEPEANGPEIMMAHAIMYSNPDAFKTMDLTPFVGKVTRAEMDQLISERAKMFNPANNQEVSPRSQISTQISFRTKMDPDLDKALDPKKNPAAYANVARDMEGHLRSITGGKRQATDKELDEAFNRATMNVIVKREGWLWDSEDNVRRFELQGGETYRVEMPPEVRQRIIASAQKNFGKAPTEAEIARIYVQHKGQKDFW
jgi:hypothetical protein